MTARTKPDMNDTTAAAAAAAITAAVLAADIHHINDDLAGIRKTIEKMCDTYLTKVEFEPVKKVVYGLVAIVLIAVAGGLVALVLR